MNTRRLAIRLAPLALIGLILVFFARLAFTNLILARGDTYAYFYPYWHAAGAALRAGRLPLWNDMLFMGAPFLANSQVGLLYPPNWPLWYFASDTPTAARLSILLHLIWAGLGTFALLRGPLRLGALAAFSGAALFAVGGHLTAHVEQINQLQGLSWLPWLFLFLLLARLRPWRWGPLLAAALALQLLSGHTQTVFISLAGLGMTALWLAWRPAESREPLRRLLPLLVLIGAGGVALLLTLPQLAPTLELSRLSNRAGGLHIGEVIAFSLHPALLGRALLPGYDLALHNEYIGTLGLAGLALAILGAWAGRKSPLWQAWIGVALLGLLLALGGWTPIYWLLGELPGFNLFRVPARWLALWALGGSVLAAYGVQRLSEGDLRVPRGLMAALGGLAFVLTAWTFLSPLATDQWIQGLVPPTPVAVLGWLITGLLLVAILARLPGRWAGMALMLLAGAELFIASRQMPYNHLTAPEAFTAQRPTASQLLARRAETTPPGRFLSISDISFGPNDQPIIQALYETQLPDDAIYDLLIATKLKDVLAPNLGMVWQLPSADGFDGGVLPLRNYTRFTRLLLENPPPDGRLREYLTAVPAQRWLDLMGVRYLVTDRSGDRWIGDVYYDLEWAVQLDAGDVLEVAHVPDFEATALGLVFEAAVEAGQRLATVELAGDDTQLSRTITSSPPQEGSAYSLAMVRWPTPRTWEAVRLTDQQAAWTLRGAALIDERSGAFQALTITPGRDWRLIHASDVKIYENQQAPPRAFLVSNAEVIPDDEAALSRMAAPDFDPWQTVILAAGEPLESAPGRQQITPQRYEPEQITLQIRSELDAYLVLSEAYYPGWTATLDGSPVPIYRANVLFRAVFVPAGDHRLEMSYTPTSWPGALLVGAGAWLALLAGVAFVWLRPR